MCGKVTILELPPSVELESMPVLKQLSKAHRYLAELKGVSETIPNQAILIDTLALQEAKDSSAIESIITTHDEMYKAELGDRLSISSAAKEVQSYAEALKAGFASVKKDRMLTCRHILDIQQILEKNDAGFRKLPGTNLQNEQTGEVIYTPPQDNETIKRLRRNLENYINDGSLSDVDELVKMAVIHFQFESIHPFYDGNGRTGRIINILYLVLQGLLDLPILYLSQYIIKNKAEYYRLLQGVRDNDDWESWIIYNLEGVQYTAKRTIVLIHGIRELMQKYKHEIRRDFKFYSQDLLNNLFRHPYTKIEFVERELNVSRLTATKYLDMLAEAGYLEKHKVSRYSYYINRALFNLVLSPASP